MLKRLAVGTLALYLALISPSSVQADQKFSANYSGSSEVLVTKKPIVVKKKPAIREIFDFLEGCRVSSMVKREVSSGIITDTSLPIGGGLELMLDTQAKYKGVVSRTGLKFLYQRELFRLYAQGAVDLNYQSAREFQFNLRLNRKFDEKVGLNLDYNRIDTFGKTYLNVNQFRLGMSYLGLEYGLSGDFNGGERRGHATIGFVNYHF